MAISLAPARGPVVRWAAEHGLGATLAVIDGPLLPALGVDASPSTVLVRGGRIVGRARTEVPRRALLRHADALAGL